MICTDAQERIKYLSVILHMPQDNILPLTLFDPVFNSLLVFFFFLPYDIHSYFFLLLVINPFVLTTIKTGL